MRIHIEKNKKDMMVDNMRILLTGVVGYVFIGFIILGIILAIMGRREGYIVLIFPAVFVGVSVFSSYSLLKKVEKDILDFDYELLHNRMKITNPMGEVVILFKDIKSVKRSENCTLIEIQNGSGRNIKMPIYTTGVKEGNIENFLDSLQCEVDNINMDSSEMEYAVEKIQNTEEQEVLEDMKEKEINEDGIIEKNEEIIQESKLEENLKVEEDKKEEEVEEFSEVKEEKEPKIEESESIEAENSETEKEDNDAAEEEEKPEDEMELQVINEEKPSEIEQHEYIELKNIVKFKDKLFNDIARQYKVMFSKVSSIIILAAALYMGITMMIQSEFLFGSIFNILAVFMIVSPTIDAIKERNKRKGIVSIGIDQHDYIVIDNGETVEKIHKDKVAVGKASNGEIIISLSDSKDKPIGISANEVIEGDPFELFKVLRVGKVKDFNWGAVLALAVSSVGLCQIPMIYAWRRIDGITMAMIISILSVVISAVLAFFALKPEDKVKKQASWTIFIDIILIVIIFVSWLR